MSRYKHNFKTTSNEVQSDFKATSREQFEKIEQFDTNAAGGKQHAVPERCEALFPRAILAVARLRQHGHDVDGYEDTNYQKIPPRVHIGRALRHILLWMAGDREDGLRRDHLVHAACRILMALEELLIVDEAMAPVMDAVKATFHKTELEQLRKAFGYEERKGKQ